MSAMVAAYGTDVVAFVSTVGWMPGPARTMVGRTPSGVKMILSVAFSALAFASAVWIAR